MIFLPKNSWGIKQTENKGRGVFAKKHIPKGAIIGDYLGIVVDNREFDFEKSPENQYVMYYSDEVSIIPESIPSPGVHCINHSCNPNCWMYPYYGHTLFFAIRNIKPGEELTIHYLLAPIGESCQTNCVHICKCESKNCSGSMHLSEEQFKIWQEFYDTQSRKTQPHPVQLNKSIKKLDLYPKNISIPEELLERIARSKVS